MSDKNDLFDRHFVFRLTTLVVVSTATIMLVHAVAGDDAAGVVAIALAAVFAKLFEQSETLQFQRQPEAPPIVVRIPVLEPWRLTVLACCFMGITLVLGDASDWLVFDILPGPADVHPHYTPWGLTVAVTLMCIAYYLAGYVATRSMIATRFSYVVWAAVIDLILAHWAYGVVRGFIRRPSEFPNLMVHPFMVTWALYVTFALIGARVGVEASAKASRVEIQTAGQPV